MKRFVIFALLLAMIISGCKTQNERNTSITTSTADANSIPKSITTAADTTAKTDESFNLSRDTVILKSEVKVSDCEELFDLKYPELIKRIGTAYVKVMTGVEASWTGYHYDELGMTFVYNDYDYSLDEAPLAWIECDADKIELNGIKEGMDYHQIQELLGHGNMKVVPYFETNYYELVYKVGNISLVFTSLTKEGEDGWELSIE